MRSKRFWLAGPLALVFLAVSAPGYGQIEDALMGLTDQNIKGYLKPLESGLETTMNSAIFRTGHVPKLGLTFKVGMAAMAVGYGDDDKVYVPTDPEGFTSLEPTEVPTVVGDAEEAVVQGENNQALIYPRGFDIGMFGIAVPELTVGAFGGTQLKLRYVAIDLRDTDLGQFTYFGVGGQHSLTQYAFGTVPVDIAAGLFFQEFEIGAHDEVQANSFYFGLTGSKSLGLARPYAAIGFERIKLNVDVENESVPGASVHASLETETNPHFTLGVAANLMAADAFIEINAAAATGIALGLSFGI